MAGLTNEQKASKISEILSLVDSPKSAWSCNNENGASQNDTSTKTQSMISQDAFYQRVSSFRPGLWSVHRISPLECASWGWKLIEKDVLQCVTCQEVICAILPDIKDRVAYLKFFGLLKDRIETNHKEACVWLYNPCPRKFAEPLHIDTVEELKNVMNSAHTLAALNSALPHLNTNRLAAVLGADNEVIDGLFKNDVANEDVKMTSVLLVLCGWCKGQGTYLRCTVCRRQVGLWSLFTIADEHKKTEPAKTSSAAGGSRKRKLSDHSNDNLEEEVPENNRRVTRQSPRKLKPNNEETKDAPPTPKRMKTRSKEDKKEECNEESSSTEMDIEKNNECLLITSPSSQIEKVKKQYFQPLEEHRYWCPWIAKINNESTDEDDDGVDKDDDPPKVFCIVTEQVRAMLHKSKELKATSREGKYAENVEGLRIIRNMLDEVSRD